MNRKVFFVTTTIVAASICSQLVRAAQDDFADIKAQITKQHDESVKRLQDWIGQVSIAAENRGYPEGADHMIKLLQEAGFDQAKQVPTDGKPGVFATLDAGAPKTVGIYFMYDVKQFDPAEWTSSPTDAALVDKPDFGKVIVGRGAVNQKGPESAFLAALHAIRAAGKKLPVNLAFVAEGEEEIGSPHFPQIVHQPEVQAALAKCEGVFIPSAEQDPDGTVTLTLGAKGVIEVELTSSGEKWGRGPKKDVHSSNKARLDSPAWHLVEALHSLVSADGNEPAIDNYTAKLRPMSAEEKAMVAKAAKRLSEAQAKKLTERRALGARRELGKSDRALAVSTNGEHRGFGRRLHRSGRQNDFAAQGGREIGFSTSAEYDCGGRHCSVESPSGEARLRRH
jgi:acetylornithine deacetylase/succinyl-diaminopimelate desuccinylase-like protein